MHPCTQGTRLQQHPPPPHCELLNCSILTGTLNKQLKVKPVFIRRMVPISNEKSVNSSQQTHTHKALGVRRPVVTHSTEWPRPDLEQRLEGGERPSEHQDWRGLVSGLACPLASGWAFTRLERSEDWERLAGLATGTLSLTRLWETQGMCTAPTGSHQHTVTPEHTGTESGFQGKPAESTTYVTRCY